MTMKFESLSSEIFEDCFQYFPAWHLIYSFSQLQHRLDQILQTIPLHLDLQYIPKLAYDALCQSMLLNPAMQKQVLSLRLSNENTPGIISDFLSKFSFDQFCQLRSLTLVYLRENDIPQVKSILRKSSQITSLHFIHCDDHIVKEFESILPITRLKILSCPSNLVFVNQVIPINRLTLSTLSLNKICRLFEYTPLLEYLKVSCVRKRLLNAEYRQSSRPVNLQQLILIDFHTTLDDLMDFLRSLSTLKSLTIDISSDDNIVEASHWQQLITSSLLSLQTFQFKLKMSCSLQLFEQFQTEFWLEEHQWHTECCTDKYSMIIYTIPYAPEFSQIPLQSRRHCNPSIDHSHTFKHINTLVASDNDLLEQKDYIFPNITSLILTEILEITNGEDERRLIDSMNFSNLKHLTIPLDCRTDRPHLLFHILRSTPRLTSLRTKGCFYESITDRCEYHRSLDEMNPKLNLSEFCSHRCPRSLTINALHRLVPNLQHLTMSLTNVADLFFLVKNFSKLSNFKVHINTMDYPQYLEVFKWQLSEDHAFVDETVGVFRNTFLITLNVWIRRNKIIF